jgi:6-phosphofructokinase 2
VIYTVTLNPALDRSITLSELKYDDANRVESEQSYAGGKGIDVSRVIRVLGGESIALGLSGGFHGMELEQRLLRQGVMCDFVQTRGETRTNILIFESKKKTHTSLNAAGPTVNEVEVGEILDKIKRLESPEYVIISGSIPRGVPIDIYREIVTIAKGKDAITALDADGEVMRYGIDECPTIIKPNIHELGRIVGRDIEGIENAVLAAEEICRNGIPIILVSMGRDGALMVTDTMKFLGIPPHVEVDSTVGAGDSFLAAFIYSHSKKNNLVECLRMGVATGAAAAMTPGTELARKDDIDTLLPKVIIKEIR